jgi:hypothetical protein
MYKKRPRSIRGPWSAWSVSSIRLLRLHYPWKPVHFLQKLLKRSAYAIKRKASELGIRKFNRGWTEKEDKLLRQVYRAGDSYYLAKLFPNKRPALIGAHARNLGLNIEWFLCQG